MTVTSYRTLRSAAEAEIEVSRSRFRCSVERVDDELSARECIERIRKQHWDARHHCSAFLIGAGPVLERSSDDGEPSGTAGAPMLDVLRGRGLSDVVAVVTRWFGGVLLGTGGLARAYGDAVREALDGAKVIERVRHEVHEIRVDHADAGRLENALRSRGVRVLGVEYADRARFRLAVEPADRALVDELVAMHTSGHAEHLPQGSMWVDRDQASGFERTEER